MLFVTIINCTKEYTTILSEKISGLGIPVIIESMNDIQFTRISYNINKANVVIYRPDGYFPEVFKAIYSFLNRKYVVIILCEKQEDVDTFNFTHGEYLHVIKVHNTLRIEEILRKAYDCKKLSETAQPEKAYTFNIPEIIYIQAARSYSIVYYESSKETVVSQSLCKIEKILSSDFLVRVHRSFIINLKYVISYNKDDFTANLSIKGKLLQIPVSRENRRRFRSIWCEYCQSQQNEQSNHLSI
jgi:DNA-binding LytR/AlgR family response regulator